MRQLTDRELEMLDGDAIRGIGANRSETQRLIHELRESRAQTAERQRDELQTEMDRRLGVLQMFARVWLGTGSDDQQLCDAHDFFSAVLNPPNLGAALDTPPAKEAT